MADWHVLGNACGATGNWFQPYSSASANTKGSWYEAISSTPYDVEALCINIIYWNDSRHYLCDIGVGAAGSEFVLLSNILLSGATTLQFPYYQIIPIRINAGTRISVRTQTASAGSVYLLMDISIIGSGGFLGLPPFNVCTPYGITESTSRAVSIDPGGTANTKGAWGEIVSSTIADHRGIFFNIGSGMNLARQWVIWKMDIGIGAASNETVIIGDFCMLSDTTGNHPCPRCSPFYPISIPAGTRISARAQCDITDSADRVFDIAVYGIR